ncbi:hypothetical protein QJS10_CPA01g02977 [Acorus calamus]|uniref:Uncharacterized protein n=1 Tax=Acorus calamus TaxID=4465 RepID=A0AAV9FUT7_ACOCL|nr:hypothetical protein QJS10_CPA01g02977 [Acorus calamus]
MSVKTNYCHLESVNNEKDRSFGTSASFPSVDWISIFDLMHQITARKTEECIRVEAISVMNLILMKTKFSSEREMFGVMALFESISRLLRKEVGSRVQEQAVHLLFLLLNCPKLLVKFCIRDEDNMEDGEVDRAQKDTSTFQGVFSGILEGLAECVICAGNGIQEMKLRRRAVIILAFIASSGKSGFEFFLSSRTPQGVNFLELVIRALAMETETETSGLAETQDICKERHLFMREVLILLNRLASNPIYATAVLGALTSSKATLGLTIDVMKRMSRKGRFYDGLKEPQESELVDLAHSFITRILSFLGECLLKG